MEQLQFTDFTFFIIKKWFFYQTIPLTFFSNDVIECNYNIGEYKVDLYFPEYNVAVQIYEVNDEILNAKKKLKNTNCILININPDKHHFDSFVEIIKIKNSLFNITKNKLSIRQWWFDY